jgi:hypothetical protein
MSGIVAYNAVPSDFKVRSSTNINSLDFGSLLVVTAQSDHRRR